MTRLWLTVLLLAAQAVTLAATQASPAAEQEPPEEDVNPELKREYVFNPLQAQKEIKIGAYYQKKGSYKAAVRRFEEALKWDPNAAEASLRLGDSYTKLGRVKDAQDAYRKYLELQPDAKEAASVRKKLGK